jgi:hypothetical protein
MQAHIISNVRGESDAVCKANCYMEAVNRTLKRGLAGAEGGILKFTPTKKESLISVSGFYPLTE